ncbi:hypothetical protein PAXINDRAFT_171515, partial [Paxillus involutus ATCC 200175]
MSSSGKNGALNALVEDGTPDLSFLVEWRRFLARALYWVCGVRRLRDQASHQFCSCNQVASHLRLHLVPLLCKLVVMSYATIDLEAAAERKMARNVVKKKNRLFA